MHAKSSWSVGRPNFFRSTSHNEVLMSTILALSSRLVTTAIAEGHTVTLNWSSSTQSRGDDHDLYCPCTSGCTGTEPLCGGES